MTPRKFFAIAAGLVISACQVTNADSDHTARMVDPDESSREELRATIKEVLGADVLLSDDALVNSSSLVIESWPAGTIANPVPHGRALGRPITFQLVKNGQDCVLVRQTDGRRFKLHSIQCEPE